MVFKEILQTQFFSITQFMIVIAIGIIVTKLILDFLNKALRKEETKKMFKEMGYDEPVIDLILMAVRYLLYFFIFIIAIAQFGFPTIVFDALIIIMILLVVTITIYSLKDFIPNAAAGIYLARVKTIKKGDYVKIGHYSGKVTEVSLLSTTLKDDAGRTTIIPNSNLTKKEIIFETKTK